MKKAIWKTFCIVRMHNLLVIQQGVLKQLIPYSLDGAYVNDRPVLNGEIGNKDEGITVIIVEGKCNLSVKLCVCGVCRGGGK